eukprot:223590-Ditylum_brightwellii.AAC.1
MMILYGLRAHLPNRCACGHCSFKYREYKSNYAQPREFGEETSTLGGATSAILQPLDSAEGSEAPLN